MFHGKEGAQNLKIGYLMTVIDLKVGYSCNDACIHCVVDDFRDALKNKHMKQDKTFAEIAQEMRSARERGDTLVITGGEPTIRSDFWDIVQLAKELDYNIMLQSNGRAFSDWAFAQNLNNYRGIFNFCIALHGPTATVHDKITQRNGSFAETVQGLRNIHKLGFSFSGKIVISLQNFRLLPEIADKFAELQAESIDIAFPHAQGRASKMWELVVPRYKDVSPFVKEAARRLQQKHVNVRLETFPYCTVSGYEHLVGEIFQQTQAYSEINQYGSNFGASNWSELRPTIKEKFPPCLSCRFRLVCEGPWNEYAYRYGGEEFKPVYGERVSDVRSIGSQNFRHQFNDISSLI
ncbi:MAG: radical SAM protein [Candidatus Bruticola sp.]